MKDSEKTKYQILTDYIIEIIESGEIKTGEKIYSENELTAKFNISRHTVRQAMSNLVNDGWLYRVQGKGTFVNNLSLNKITKTKTIGVVTTYLSDYIFPSIIKGIDGVLSVNGYSIVLGCTYNQHEKERLCLENLITQNIAGLIVEPTKSALPNPNIHLYKKFIDLGIPILFIHGSYKELPASYIVEDDIEAGYLATKYLIYQGHKKIVGIFKIDDIQGHFRFSGFQKAHFEANIPISDSRTLWFETEDIESKINIRKSQIQELLSQCTAVVCYNDQIALKIINVAKKMKLRIPQDISIVSFDDSQLALASEVKLSTIAHPKEKLGEEAAKAMISLLENNTKHYDLKIVPELIIRDSVQSLNEK